MLKFFFLRDTDASQLSKKERTLYFLLILFFFAIYIPGLPWLYNACMWLFFAYSFFFNSLKEKWMLLKKRKEIIIMTAFFILNFLSALLSENQKEGISLVGIRISLFVIPISLGTLYIKSNLKDRLIFGFALATTCAAFGSLLWGTWHVMKSQDWSLLYNDNLSNIINLQSIYFAMLVNLSIFSFVYLFLKRPGLVNKKILVPLLLLLFVVHFLLASRIAFIILYSSVLVFSIFQIVFRKKIAQGIKIIVALVLCSFLMSKIFPKTINRFKELSYTKFDFRSVAKESHFNAQLTPDQWNGANLRIAVWQCTWAVIKNNMLFGTGLGDKMSALKKEYAQKSFSFGITTNRNTHNNYLDIWMSLGLVGLFIFLYGFIILPFIHCIPSNDWYGIIIIVCFVLSLFTETYMDRTIGNTLLAFFLTLIASYKKPQEADF